MTLLLVSERIVWVLVIGLCLCMCGVVRVLEQGVICGG